MNELENTRVNYLQKIKKDVKEFGVSQDYDLSLVDKLVMLSSIFFIPLIYSFIFFILQVTNVVLPLDATYSTLFQVNQYVFLLIVPALGMVYGLFKFRQKMIEYKILGIFLATIGPIGIAFTLVLNSIIPEHDVAYLVETIVYGSIVVFFYLYKNDDFYEMIKKSYKTNIAITLCTIILGCLVYFLLNLIFSNIQVAVNGNDATSANQSELESYLLNPVGIVGLFLSSVIFSPIIEEFSYRMIFMNITDNRWYSYVLVIFYFAFLHVQQNADFQHIFTYFSLGIINGFIFWYLKNLTPCIMIHLITNLITFILLFSGINGTL